ncbi:hypothetical protein DU500_05320 [Haloplanus rubicundus]|uniref:Uncharacterized protein n=1 Tax=Haloplanus rubicundus TaxID=1547898 RepID=A0A345EAN0_9EURY|nr:hypothetical protein [Haloplanus rubicundus]AXG05905.1 hypothetical protein DU500_05320 [Haloplanus rubicundus]AXG09252.1 hypothetical protein DU484_04880 [Haloplanus rubicundus]
MAFELGFLVGSLALLGIVLYFTRIRGPSLPHEAMAEGTGEGERDGQRPGPAAGPAPTVEACELCGENPATQSVNDMAVCAQCDEDLL